MDLLAAGTGFKVVAETDALVFEFGDARGQVLHVEDDAVPAAGFLVAAVGEGAGAGGAGAAQDELEIADGDLAESRQVLHV